MSYGANRIVETIYIMNPATTVENTSANTPRINANSHTLLRQKEEKHKVLKAAQAKTTMQHKAAGPLQQGARGQTMPDQLKRGHSGPQVGVSTSTLDSSQPMPNKAAALVSSNSSPNPAVATSKPMNSGAHREAVTKSDIKESVTSSAPNDLRPPEGKVVNSQKNVQVWLETIRGCSTRFVNEIVATGKVLCSAREAFGRDWNSFKKSNELPFKARKADMLMRIANNSTLASAHNHAHLPDAWTTLSILAGLDDALLQKGIEDGKITQRMSLKEAKALDPTKETKPRGLLTSAALNGLAKKIVSSIPAWAGNVEIVKSLVQLENAINSAKAEIKLNIEAKEEKL